MSKVTFEIENKEYELKDFLSIEDYQKIYMIKDFIEEEFYQTKLINAITGIKNDLLIKTNHIQINYLSNYILSLFPDTKYPFIDKFTLNGIEYGFIPSWKKMSFAEFVDLDTFMNKTPEEIVNNLHILCAIMYRPIISKRKEHDFKIEEYDIDKMEERAELFLKELDVKYVLGGQFFFSRFAKESLNYIPQSLTQKMRNYWIKIKITWKMRKIIWKLLLGKPLDGLQLSTEYAKMTLQSINKSQRLGYWKRLTNSFTSLKKKKKLKD